MFRVIDCDAGLTSLDNAGLVVEAEYEYVFGLKGNQPELYSEAQALLLPLAKTQEPELQTPWESRNGKCIRRSLWRTNEMAGMENSVGKWTHLRQTWLVRQETRGLGCNLEELRLPPFADPAGVCSCGACRVAPERGSVTVVAELKTQTPVNAARLIALGLAWSGVPLDVRLTPWSPSQCQIKQLVEASGAVYRAAEAATQAFVVDEAVRAHFGYDAEREACILADPGYAPNLPFGRFDLHLGETTPKFLELNTDGTAGWYWAARLAGLALDAPGCLRPRPLPHQLLHMLLRCFRQWDRRGVDRPRIGIVDWAGVATALEQQSLAACFAAQGYPCSLEDPRGLKLSGGRLYGTQGRIDLVYRRLVSEDAFARRDEVETFFRGYLEGSACFVGSFRTDPAWSKTLFSLLSDPAFQQRLPPADAEWVRRTVPWTVRVAPGPVAYGGREHDLVHLLRHERPGFLLKPARGYAGAHVCAGRYTPDDEWSARVVDAAKTGGWVAQEYVAPPAYPDAQDECLRYLHIGAFMVGGQLAGLLARCSRTPVLVSMTPEVWLPTPPAGISRGGACDGACTKAVL